MSKITPNVRSVKEYNALNLGPDGARLDGKNKHTQALDWLDTSNDGKIDAAEEAYGRKIGALGNNGYLTAKGMKGSTQYLCAYDTNRNGKIERKLGEALMPGDNGNSN